MRSASPEPDRPSVTGNPIFERFAAMRAADIRMFGVQKWNIT